jgi:hypothetical protein
MAHGGSSGDEKSSGHVLDTVIDFVCGSIGKQNIRKCYMNLMRVGFYPMSTQFWHIFVTYMLIFLITPAYEKGQNLNGGQKMLLHNILFFK